MKLRASIFQFLEIENQEWIDVVWMAGHGAIGIGEMGVFRPRKTCGISLCLLARHLEEMDSFRQQSVAGDVQDLEKLSPVQFLPVVELVSLQILGHKSPEVGKGLAVERAGGCTDAPDMRQRTARPSGFRTGSH